MKSSLYEKGKNYIDYKLGVLGAGFMGGLVWMINGSGGDASIAALKQGAYSFFIGGFIMKTCESLATKIRDRRLALTSSVIVPSLITVGSTYAVHKYIKESPKPLESTVPTMVLVPLACAAWGIKKRKNLENKVE